MYCSKCGKKIPENSKFCRYCGGAIDTHKIETIADTEKKRDVAKLEYAGFWIRLGAYIIDLLGKW